MGILRVPLLAFREDVGHYQKTPGREWISYVAVNVQQNGWVVVTYEDDAEVMYPPSAFQMIVTATSSKIDSRRSSG